MSAGLTPAGMAATSFAALAHEPSPLGNRFEMAKVAEARDAASGSIEAKIGNCQLTRGPANGS
jgi:hypothetical protein